jgi:cytochrome c2
MFRATITAAVLVFASTVAIANGTVGDATNGEKLFKASECLSCHGVEVFTAPDKKVKDLKALDAQVRLDDSNLNTNWFDTEIYDVVAYLNEQYYKFPEATQ